ncbi:MAG: hypothetical protein WKG07_29640 [Hymenobacter sp.]
MNYDEVAGRWYLDVELPAGPLSYKYVLLAADETAHLGSRANRTLVLAGSAQRLLLADYWHTPAVPENELFTAAFTEALFRAPGRQGPAEAPAKAAKGKKRPGGPGAHQRRASGRPAWCCASPARAWPAPGPVRAGLRPGPGGLGQPPVPSVVGCGLPHLGGRRARLPKSRRGLLV